MMDDSKRNEIVVSVASKIKQDGVSYAEQAPSIMEQYVKHALLLGAGEPDAQEIVAESFLYLQMQNSSDEDPLQKGDKFGVGFS